MYCAEGTNHIRIVPGVIDRIGSTGVDTLHLGKHLITGRLLFGLDDTLFFKVRPQTVVVPIRELD